MSLAKLLAMLQKSSLYLTRVDQLLQIDPFEGSIPRRYESERIAAKRFKPLREHKKQISRQVIYEIMRQRAEMHRRERSKTFVSCWYSGQHDSDAMWRHAGINGDGSVAVRTTVARLSNALPDWAYVGRVAYKDYERDVFPTTTCWSPFFHKRECFAHEREVRVLVNPSVDDIGNADALNLVGLEIPADMNRLLTRIYVSPAAPAWFLETVTRAARDLGIKCPITRAPMDVEPAF